MKTLYQLFLLSLLCGSLSAFSQPFKQIRNRGKTSIRPQVPKAVAIVTTLESVEHARSPNLVTQTSRSATPGSRRHKITRKRLSHQPPTKTYNRDQLVYYHQQGRDHGPIRSHYAPLNRAAMRRR